MWMAREAASAPQACMPPMLRSPVDPDVPAPGVGLPHFRQPGLPARVSCLDMGRKGAASPITGEKAPPPISRGWTPPYLEQVVSGGYVGDVDPLAVDVMAIHVPAAHGDALLTEVGTLVILLDVCSQGQREAWSPCTPAPLPQCLPSALPFPHRAPRSPGWLGAVPRAHAQQISSFLQALQSRLHLGWASCPHRVGFRSALMAPEPLAQFSTHIPSVLLGPAECPSSTKPFLATLAFPFAWE